MPENPPTNANLESQLDALMAEMATAPDDSSDAPGDALIDRAVDTALQSQAPPPESPEVATGNPEVSDVSPEIAEAPEELATAKAQTQETPKTQGTTENPAEAAVNRATDLASQLDALIEAPAATATDDAVPQDSEEPDVPDESLAGDFVSHATLNGEPEPPATQPKPDAVESLPGGDEGPALATATEKPLDQNEDEGNALQGDFVSEAELIGRVDTQLEAQAKEQIKADATDDFSQLAGMLGVDTDALTEVPETKEQEAEPEELDELDEFDGAFQSPDDLLAESVAADAPGNFEQDDEDELDDFAFATPEEILNEQPEEESWHDPQEPEQAETPDLTAERDDHPQKQKLTTTTTPPAPTKPSSEEQLPGGDEGPAAATQPEPKKQPTTGPKVSPWKPHIDRACAAGRKLRPYLAQVPHTTVFLTKASCYYANAPVDFLANRLAKDDKPAMPLKSWVGLAGAAVLIPGTLLMLVGLFT